MTKFWQKSQIYKDLNQFRNMTSIRDIVRDYILSKPAIAQCFSQELINQSALARLIIKDLKLEKHVDAVISTLRRIDLNDIIFDTAQLPEYAVSTRTGLKGSHVSLAEAKKILQKQNSMQLSPMQVLRTIELNDTVYVIADDNTMEQLGIKVTHEIGEIILLYDDQADISLLLRVITAELDLAQVHVHGIVAGKNELIIAVAEEDVNKVKLQNK